MVGAVVEVDAPELGLKLASCKERKYMDEMKNKITVLFQEEFFYFSRDITYQNRHNK